MDSLGRATELAAATTLSNKLGLRLLVLNFSTIEEYVLGHVMTHAARRVDAVSGAAARYRKNDAFWAPSIEVQLFYNGIY